MKKLRANYGLDAPSIVKKLSLAVIIALFFSVLLLFIIPNGIMKYLLLLACFFTLISLLYPIVAIVCGSYFLKFKVRDELLNQIPWQGNELVLDVGCGRGLLLIGAAKKIKTGTVIGIDIWNQDDQSNNNQHITTTNATLEGVLDKIEIITTDMRSMPFPDCYFDVVTSSWAIHNISNKQERRKALQEIIRVLKPGGYIAIADIQCTQEYYDLCKEEKFFDLSLIGPRYTFGTPTFILVGKKQK